MRWPGSDSGLVIKKHILFTDLEALWQEAKQVWSTYPGMAAHPTLSGIAVPKGLMGHREN